MIPSLGAIASTCRICFTLRCLFCVAGTAGPRESERFRESTFSCIVWVQSGAVLWCDWTYFPYVWRDSSLNNTMFALVRFVEDDKDKRYVISVADIENFEPKNELDFDNTKTYDAYWQDEDEDNSGIYVVQILKLAATKEEMEREMKVKRVHVPPIRMSEVDNVTECGVPAAARKKSLKQQEKAKQQNQITSKKQQYEDVLKRHVSHSLQKNAAIPGHSSIGRKASKKRKPQILDDSTESEDESVVSSRELKNAVKEAKYWKQRYRLEQEHTASLKRELDFLKRKVELQLSSFQQTLDEVAKRQQDALPVVAPSILPNGAVEASRRDPTAARGAATEQAAAAEKDVGGTASVVPTPAGPSEEAPASSCFTADAPRSAELEASVLDDAQDFTLTSGGLARKILRQECCCQSHEHL
ncbi:hypothetical protein V5799_025263 [Amblyomma americanum]|uniref:Uncharacterized protein n=1 Tax=Amblyomma americanum TaxID=6943 RepID=A0AAQ4EA73_AMBAM